MKLRPHQARMQQLCQEILDGADIRQIIASVIPGGGKSKLPVILASMLIPKFADRLLWVVPRNSLKWQGEQEFFDPMLPTDRRLRASSGNEVDPVRGTDGYITTYQAIGMSPEQHLKFCRAHRTILFNDEQHHVGQDAFWGQAMDEIRRACVLVVDASGTLSRHDGNQIHGMEYGGATVDLCDRPGVRVITYGRRQAMDDGAILPVELVPIDGAAEWNSKEGVHRKVASIKRAQDSDRSGAIFTALRTDFAFQVLETCLAHWVEMLKTFPSAKVLVVAPDIEWAQIYQRHIAGRFLSEIATSDDSPDAARAIRDFKRGAFPILVSVAMAAEGLSVPEVTHIACLTQIRSKEWLEQMGARGNRCCPGKTQAWCFAPADKAMLEAWAAIEREALTPLASQEEQFGNGAAMAPGEGSGLKAPSIEPLWSTAHGVADLELDFRATTPVPPSVAEGILRKNIRALRVDRVDNAPPGSIKAMRTIWNYTVRQVCDKDLDAMDTEKLTAVWVALRGRFRER